MAPAVLHLPGTGVEGTENHPVLFNLHPLHIYYVISPLPLSLLPWAELERTNPTPLPLFKTPLEGSQILC